MTVFKLKGLNGKLQIKTDNFEDIETLLPPLLNLHKDSYDLSISSDSIEQTIGIATFSDSFMVFVCEPDANERYIVTLAEDVVATISDLVFKILFK